MFDESTDESVTLRYEDGTRRALDGGRARGSPIHVGGAPATQAVFIARDLTESVAAQAQLAESRETTRAFSTPQLIRSS